MFAHVRITRTVYNLVSVGLFARHRQMFSFTLCATIMRANAHHKLDESHDARMITDLDWTVFLQGNIMAAIMDDEIQRKISSSSGLYSTDNARV